MALKRTAAKNAAKKFTPSTTPNMETYPKPGVSAKTTAKNAAQAARKPATTVTARPTTGVTGGGNKTAAKNGSFVSSRTPTMSSYAGKSGTTKKKLY